MLSIILGPGSTSLYKTDQKNKRKQNPVCIELAGETEHNQLSDSLLDGNKYKEEDKLGEKALECWEYVCGVENLHRGSGRASLQR